jgi:hypothetical protein
LGPLVYWYHDCRQHNETFLIMIRNEIQELKNVPSYRLRRFRDFVIVKSQTYFIS